jgi:hypothetical protein
MGKRARQNGKRIRSRPETSALGRTPGADYPAGSGAGTNQESRTPHQAARPKSANTKDELGDSRTDSSPNLGRSDVSRPYFTCSLHSQAGSVNHDYQDAAGADPVHGVVAVADGTTMGGESGIVADSLVKYFISERFRLERPEERRLWWPLVRRRWYMMVRPIREKGSSAEQAKLDRGGSSTFLGLRMEGRQLYRLYSIGDCTLFWFEAGKFVHADGALTHDSHPAALNVTDEHADEQLLSTRAAPLPGDTAVLATDSLAKYLLRARPWERDSRFWHQFSSYGSEDFTRWTDRLKSDGLIDADDFTLVVLHFPARTGPADDSAATPHSVQAEEQLLTTGRNWSKY